MLGTVALAVVGEGLTWFRRNRMSGAAALARPGRLGELVRWLRRGPARWRAAMASLFAVQATLGYFLMLIAMTYQGELFIAVIFGLGLGHAAFNVSAPVSESADACCVDDTADADADAGGGVTLATKVHPAALLNGGGANGAHGGGATTAAASAAHAATELVRLSRLNGAPSVRLNTGDDAPVATADGSASPYEHLTSTSTSPASIRVELGSTSPMIYSTTASLAAAEAATAAASAAEKCDAPRTPLSPSAAESAAQRTLVLRVTPMTCAGCQRRVLTALTAVDGVSGVHVELATETATVQGDASVSEAAIIAAAAAAGKTAVVVAC